MSRRYRCSWRTTRLSCLDHIFAWPTLGDLDLWFDLLTGSTHNGENRIPNPPNTPPFVMYVFLLDSFIKFPIPTFIVFFFVRVVGVVLSTPSGFVSVQTAFSFFCVVLFVYCASCIPTQIIVVLVCCSPRFASCEPRPESVVTQRGFRSHSPTLPSSAPSSSKACCPLRGSYRGFSPFTPARTLFAFPSSATPKMHITSPSPTHPRAGHTLHRPS